MHIHIPHLQPADRATISAEGPKNTNFPITRLVLRLESRCKLMLRSKGTNIQIPCRPSPRLVDERSSRS